MKSWVIIGNGIIRKRWYWIRDSHQWGFVARRHVRFKSLGVDWWRLGAAAEMVLGVFRAPGGRWSEALPVFNLSTNYADALSTSSQRIEDVDLSRVVVLGHSMCWLNATIERSCVVAVLECSFIFDLWPSSSKVLSTGQGKQLVAEAVYSYGNSIISKVVFAAHRHLKFSQNLVNMLLLLLWFNTLGRCE